MPAPASRSEAVVVWSGRTEHSGGVQGGGERVGLRARPSQLPGGPLISYLPGYRAAAWSRPHRRLLGPVYEADADFRGLRTPSLVAAVGGGPAADTVPEARLDDDWESVQRRAGGVSGADAVYTYDPTTDSYQETSTLQTGQGAWTYSADGGTVTFTLAGP